MTNTDRRTVSFSSFPQLLRAVVVVVINLWGGGGLETGVATWYHFMHVYTETCTGAVWTSLERCYVLHVASTVAPPSWWPQIVGRGRVDHSRSYFIGNMCRHLIAVFADGSYANPDENRIQTASQLVLRHQLKTVPDFAKSPSVACSFIVLMCTVLLTEQL